MHDWHCYFRNLYEYWANTGIYIFIHDILDYKWQAFYFWLQLHKDNLIRKTRIWQTVGVSVYSRWMSLVGYLSSIQPDMSEEEYSFSFPSNQLFFLFPSFPPVLPGGHLAWNSMDSFHSDVSSIHLAFECLLKLSPLNSLLRLFQTPYVVFWLVSVLHIKLHFDSVHFSLQVLIMSVLVSLCQLAFALNLPLAWSSTTWLNTGISTF